MSRWLPSRRPYPDESVSKLRRIVNPLADARGSVESLSNQPIEGSRDGHGAVLRSDRFPHRLWKIGPFTQILIAAAILAGSIQAQCRFDLANQSDSSTGFLISLQATPDTHGNCALSTAILRFTVGDGTQLHHVDSTFPWQTGVIYTVKATLTSAGPQQLSVNGQLLSLQQKFAPALVPLSAAVLADSGTAVENYLVNPISLQISSGTNTLNISPNAGKPIADALLLLGGGPAIWNSSFEENASLTTTVTATFQIDAAIVSPHQLDPYIDPYGQAVASVYPGKIQSDADLQTALQQEQAWLAANPPLGGLDQYGGSTVAGWTDKNTGYYHTALHNGRWFLISPLGNPLFYIGITQYGLHTTPITGREGMFQLPPKNGPLAAAYALNVYGDPKDTTYFSHETANLIRKYGTASSDITDAHLRQRLASWVFMGGGKFGNYPDAMPVTPLIGHNDAAAVPPAVPGGHADVFDPAVVAKMKALYAKQIGKDATNPYVVGWAVGNESEEQISNEETTAMLALGASSPAKKALVDQALAKIYSGSVAALASAWKITASTAADVYASKPTPPAKDIETLRQFFAQDYYSTNYATIKAIDPNHLYFGSWITAGDSADWSIAAANCDVVGFDDFFPGAFTAEILGQFAASNKPVMLGAFGVPSDYGGTRGFGSSNYSGAMTLSDSASGDEYSQRLASAAANPYVVGTMLFNYSDEPLTGRGDSSGVGNITTNLVVDEAFAFGLTDVTDTPKYDFVNKVRAANIATLQSLGLLGAAPVLASPPANGATYVAGGLVPGSWAEVKGSGLSDLTRIWADADFAGLGNKLPTSLSGVQVLVNGIAAAVYYVSSTQVSFQVPAGVTGTATVQVIRDGLPSNMLSASAAAVSPGIFPIVERDKVYPAAVFLDGKIAGDSSINPVFRSARVGELVELFATGLAASSAGVLPSAQSVAGVTVTIGPVTVPAQFAGLVAVGEYQINVSIPQAFASMPEGEYPISISVGGVASPATVNGVTMKIPIVH